MVSVMLYQLWPCAVILSSSLLPFLSRRFSLDTRVSVLELLRTVVLRSDAAFGTDIVEMHIRAVPAVAKTVFSM